MAAIANKYNWAWVLSGNPDIAASIEDADNPKDVVVKTTAKTIF